MSDEPVERPNPVILVVSGAVILGAGVLVGTLITRGGDTDGTGTFTGVIEEGVGLEDLPTYEVEVPEGGTLVISVGPTGPDGPRVLPNISTSSAVVEAYAEQIAPDVGVPATEIVDSWLPGPLTDQYTVVAGRPEAQAGDPDEIVVTVPGLSGSAFPALPSGAAEDLPRDAGLPAGTYTVIVASPTLQTGEFEITIEVQ